MQLFGVHLTWAFLHYHEVKAAVAQLITIAVVAPYAPALCRAVCASADTILFEQVSLDADTAVVSTTHVIISALVVLGLLHSSYIVQRRIASGLPLHAESYSDYVKGSDAMNVRSTSRASEPTVPSQRRPVAVVTGGNGGIGWWNGLDLSLLGYDVLLCCRSRRRGEESIEKMLRWQQERSSAVCGSVTFLVLDLEEAASIRNCAAAVMERTENGTHLRVVINNAGMFSPSLGQRTAFGDERLVGVNFTGVVLFTELILRATLAHRAVTPGMPLRIVNVASIAHSWARVTHSNFVELLSESINMPNASRGPTVNTYGFSKLLLISYTRALAASLRSNPRAHGVTVASVHPGAVLTEIFRELGFVASHVMPVVLSTIFKQPPEGAETTLYAALSTEVRSGSYYADCQLMDGALSPLATDHRLSQEVLRRVRARWGLAQLL
jgi:NAD(P)-dependent dehydrogenase (short-subunit alcohol dehydrogenase family)